MAAAALEVSSGKRMKSVSGREGAEREAARGRVPVSGRRAASRCSLREAGGDLASQRTRTQTGEAGARVRGAALAARRPGRPGPPAAGRG